MSVLEPVASGALTSEITAKLRDAILDGTYQPGQQLSQAEIARQLETSRGPVREALLLLVGEGLIKEIPRRGSFVTKLSVQQIGEILDVRVALEVRAAQLILRDRPDGWEALLENVLIEMEAAIACGDANQILSLDVGFHEELCRASENTWLLSVFKQVSNQLRIYIRLDNAIANLSGGSILDEHRRLFDALLKGAGEEFSDLIVRHIEQTRLRLLQRLSD
ncbi:transcriptional regulator, GntR family [Plantibacter sp. VKM Ac-1784]|uniref:Transcriptional regulator, GntR family n=1 Tax=Plantibacter elymi (nom. nud.) TaxID=199708 RepID=A0ABY1RE05_9MICO|nr:GntR family transcriptional regulator [Plantibacter sp. VKM Ac-1784]SMQ71141.1 transcriptional regulator, GntR family [Plantibacter sp. VKM Ac-1784]